VVYLVKKHFPLLILVSSTLSLFLISILLKKHLTPKEYGELSMLLTYISLIFQIGLLGLEQVVLRFATLTQKNFSINKKVLELLVAVMVLSVFLSTMSMLEYFSRDLWTYLLLIVVSSIVSMLYYNVYRLTNDLNLAQVALNGWKMLLLPIIIINILNIDIRFIIEVTAFSMCIIAAFMLVRFIKNYQIVVYKSDQEHIYFMWFNFFLALLIGALIGFSDRYLIEYYLDIEQLGEYFFYLTVILFPYALFQTYFGFKELPQFRKAFSLTAFHKKTLKVMLYSLILTVILVLIFTVVNTIEFLEQYHITNYYLISILMATGVIKMNYSILSAAMGAIAEKKVFLQNNFFMLLSLVIFFFIFLNLNFITMEKIALIYLFIWITRAIVYYLSIIKIYGTM